MSFVKMLDFDISMDDNYGTKSTGDRNKWHMNISVHNPFSHRAAYIRNLH